MERILDKFTSGRFLMTIVAAFVMAFACVSQPQTIGEWKEVIVMIIMFYFNRNTIKSNENQAP